MVDNHERKKEQVEHKFVLHGYVHTKHLHVHSRVG